MEDRTGKRRRKIRNISVGIVLTVVAVLVLAQLFLPSLAGDWAESNTAEYGEDVQISVAAFPAVELLFQQADNVKMTARVLTPRSNESILGQLNDTDKFSAQIGTLDAGRAPLQRVRIEKGSNDDFHLIGNLNRADLIAALPPGVSLQNRPAAANEIPVRLGAGLLGKGIDTVLSVETSDGAVVIRVHLPGALGLVSSLEPISVFEDSHLAAEKITMTPVAGGWKIGFEGHVR